MITGAVQKSQPKESLADALLVQRLLLPRFFYSLPNVSYSYWSPSPGPSQTYPIGQNAPPSGPKLDLRMKNLEQFVSYLEDGILSQEEFDSQKKIVVLYLNSLA